ncbi:MAG TPA: TlpA disulfide reductase family protein, partial [Alphaproteobacteria bacterium]|nr:TlpA disulfide reductase family protein [Alphaproteobacteria bacterium]
PPCVFIRRSPCRPKPLPQVLPHPLPQLLPPCLPTRLLNLWATWCHPCVEEMPSLGVLQEKLGSDKLTLVALNEDRNGAMAAHGFLTRHNLQKIAIYVDTSGRVPSLMHAHGMPTSFLVDPNGMGIGYIEGGADWSDAATLAFLQSKMKL